MKLVRLKLINFASIWTAMNKKEIDINFKKCKNHVVLLVGRNGSGKTSLLSNLHPFPHLGTLDLRNSQDLIRDGLDGYKLFECSDGKINYKIEHMYLYNNGKRKILSYIKKNGTELNSSGSVKSFIEIINMEMGLDPTFLKILRLGPNTIDLINLKASERKDFISTLLADVDIYNQLFKVANEESKYVKNNLKVVTSKYDGLSDEKELISEQQSLNNLLEQVEEAKANIIKTYYTTKGQLDTLVLSENEKVEYLSEYNTNKQQIEYYLHGNRAEAKQFMLDYQKDKEEYNQLTNQKSNLLSLRDNMQVDLTKVKEQLTDYQNSYKIIKERESVSDMEAKIKSCLEQIKAYKSQIKVSCHHSLETYLQLFQGYNNIITLKDKIYEYPMQSLDFIKEHCIGIKGDEIYNELDKLVTEKLKKTSEKLAEQKILDKLEHKQGMIRYIPKDCELYEHCPYYLSTLKINSKSSSSYESLAYEFEIMDGVRKVLIIFKNIEDEMKKLNKGLYDSELKLSFEQLLVMIFNQRDNAKLSKFISKIQSFIDSAQAKVDLAKEEELLDRYNKEKVLLANDTSINLLTKEITKCETEIQTKETTLNQYKKELAKVEEAITKLEDSLAEHKEYYLFVSNTEEHMDTLKDMVDHYHTLSNSRRYEDQLQSLTQEFKAQLDHYEHTIQTTKTSLDRVRFALNEKKKYKDEKKQLEDRYEYTEIIKDSLSSSKGIPLIFIQLHLKNIQILANQIIHEMFDQNISLNDFIITEKEFAMPYTVNGITINDVSLSSQGERTTIAMALSFAILQQFTTKYNVMLLDEMDGPLYKENKEKFIRIVERQMEKIGSEQIVMITHNNLFEDYPVDLICTSPMNDNDYSASNIIWEV